MFSMETETLGNLLTIQLDGKKLYKMSHGAFKEKKDQPILNTFEQNNWAVIHEDTKKGQNEIFKI